ncbi:flagellar hook-length control protein FliK [Buchnera aphidicola]|uniref:flagellar hook-length control protein FliK n=1 Tax=Buchnera aphidicola TaxID=9 RepID=UPI003CE487E8
MPEIINNIQCHKNIISQNNNFKYSLCKFDLFTSIFDAYNTYSLKKEIKFHSIPVEEKKYDDNSIIYSNFHYMLNNLLNVLDHNKKTIYTNQSNHVKHKNIQNNTIDINNDNHAIQFNDFLRNTFNIKIKQENNEAFLKKKLSRQINRIVKKYKNDITKNNKIYEHYPINKSSNLHFSQTKNQSYQKQLNWFIKNIDFSDHDKKIVFTSDVNKFKNDLDFPKIENKIYTEINHQNKLNLLSSNELDLLNIQKIVLQDSNNFIKWKDFISQKILSFIAHNNSHAKINLKPESLGSINIIMNIKNNNIILQLISENHKVRILFNKCIPFLSHELNKQGMILEKCNILSSLKHYRNIYNNKKCSKKSIDSINQFQKTINTCEQKSSFMEYKKIDWYV